MRDRNTDAVLVMNVPDRARLFGGCRKSDSRGRGGVSGSLGSTKPVLASWLAAQQVAEVKPLFGKRKYRTS